MFAFVSHVWWCLVWRAQTVLCLACLLRFSVWKKYLGVSWVTLLWCCFCLMNNGLFLTVPASSWCHSHQPNSCTTSFVAGFLTYFPRGSVLILYWMDDQARHSSWLTQLHVQLRSWFWKCHWWLAAPPSITKALLWRNKSYKVDLHFYSSVCFRFLMETNLQPDLQMSLASLLHQKLFHH